MSAAIVGNGSDPHDATEAHATAARRLAVHQNIAAARVQQLADAADGVDKAIAAMFTPVFNEGAAKRMQAAKAATMALDALMAAETLFAEGTAHMIAAVQHGTPDVLVAAVSTWNAGDPMVSLPLVYAQRGHKSPIVPSVGKCRTHAGPRASSTRSTPTDAPAGVDNMSSEWSLIDRRAPSAPIPRKSGVDRGQSSLL